MKKQNVLGKIVKEMGAKAAIKAGDRASIALCYQPKDPKGLDKFNK